MTRKEIVVGPEGRPFSRVVRAGDLVWLAGVVPPREVIDNGGGIAEQTEAVLQIISGLLAKAGTGVEHVIRTGVYLTDASHFDAMNQVFRRVFPKDPPVRTTVVTALVAPGALVEIDCVAAVPGTR